MNPRLIALVLLAAMLAGCVQQAPSSTDLVRVTVLVNNQTIKTVDVPHGTSAFDAFSAAIQMNYSVHPVFGKFVTGVNGLEQSVEQNKFWQYYANGELASVGVDAYLINGTTTLEWRYESPPAYL